jgi:hypothetical protein
MILIIPISKLFSHLFVTHIVRLLYQYLRWMYRYYHSIFDDNANLLPDEDEENVKVKNIYLKICSVSDILTTEMK